MSRPKIQTSDGRGRFVRIDGQVVDREMDPKVLKAQLAYAKKKRPHRATPKK